MAGLRQIRAGCRLPDGGEPLPATRCLQSGNPDQRRPRLRGLGAAAELRYPAHQRDPRGAADRRHPGASRDHCRRAAAQRRAASCLGRIRPVARGRWVHRERPGFRIDPRRRWAGTRRATCLGRFHRLASSPVARPRPHRGDGAATAVCSRLRAPGCADHGASSGGAYERGGAGRHCRPGSGWHRGPDSAVRLRPEQGLGRRRGRIPEHRTAGRRPHGHGAVRRSPRAGPGRRRPGHHGWHRAEQLSGGARRTPAQRRAGHGERGCGASRGPGRRSRRRGCRVRVAAGARRSAERSAAHPVRAATPRWCCQARQPRPACRARQPARHGRRHHVRYRAALGRRARAGSQPPARHRAPHGHWPQLRTRERAQAGQSSLHRRGLAGNGCAQVLRSSRLAE